MAKQFDPYAGYSTEPDLRQEFFNTMSGKYPEVSKRQHFVHRKMKTDDDGRLIPCSCVDAVTKEPDIDRYCAFCLGEGYFWVESIIEGYKRVVSKSPLEETFTAPGVVNPLQIAFYLDADFAPNYYSNEKCPDKIVQLQTDKEGTLVRPYKRLSVLTVSSIIAHRADSGKIEYWQLNCHEKYVKFLNGATG